MTATILRQIKPGQQFVVRRTKERCMLIEQDPKSPTSWGQWIVYDFATHELQQLHQSVQVLVDPPAIDFADYETQRRVMLEYLQVMAARGDWHGVADAAMDLREMEAERKYAVPAMPE